jgi:hypothetical protein
MTTSFFLEASDRCGLATGFGSRGLDLTHFENRAARRKANNGLEEEVYVLRRYLFSLDAAGMLSYPLRLVKNETPDFVGKAGGEAYGIEVTEATLARDQREMTLAERVSEPSLLGAHGGRYPHGIRYGGDPRGRPPDRDLTGDVLRAVRRKRALPYPPSALDLLLYANGNAARMAELETTLTLLESRFLRWNHHLVDGTQLKTIAIVLDGEKKLVLWSSVCGLRVLELHATLAEDAIGALQD